LRRIIRFRILLLALRHSFSYCLFMPLDTTAAHEAIATRFRQLWTEEPGPERDERYAALVDEADKLGYYSEEPAS
jgi:hypothetical protein